MKKLLRVLVVISLAAFASLGSGVAAGPGPHGVTSDNVEHVDFLPFEVGTATGAAVVGDHLYVTSWRSFSIYDVSDPLDPELLSNTPLGFKFQNEDVSTNGRIMLFAEQAPIDALHVWDVEDKTNPQQLAMLVGGGTHTATCILDCAYSYGTYDFAGPEGPSTGGALTDLRKPAEPEDLGHWNEDLPADRIHDVTEVAPGLVLTASAPIMFLDARKNAKRPKLLAQGPNLDKREHSAIWPRKGRDRFVITSFETNATPRCEAGTGAVTTWDASKWRKTRSFNVIDEWTITNGTYLDGRTAGNGLGCSPHWVEEHPTFRNGGIIAVGYYDHGTRFLRVSPKGKIKEEEFFQPWRGSTSAAYWLTNRIVYAVDYERGVDILRYTGDF